MLQQRQWSGFLAIPIILPVVMVMQKGLRSQGQEFPLANKEVGGALVLRAAPLGGIPAITEPNFVPADQAKIGNDAFVIGVCLKGECCAYSLRLLNHHEIVNDNLGGEPVAVTW